MLIWACWGKTWQTSAAFWVPTKESNLLLSATHTHLHTPPKSLARMTGDGQKQIMVIDRCLEMDLCVCVCLLVCQNRGWGLRAVCKSYWFCPVGRICLWIKVSFALSHLLVTCHLTSTYTDTHTHRSIFIFNNGPITKSDGRSIKLKCLSKKEMNPTLWIRWLLYSDSINDLHTQ